MFGQADSISGLSTISFKRLKLHTHVMSPKRKKSMSLFLHTRKKYKFGLYFAATDFLVFDCGWINQTVNELQLIHCTGNKSKKELI